MGILDRIFKKKEKQEPRAQDEVIEHLDDLEIASSQLKEYQDQLSEYRSMLENMEKKLLEAEPTTEGAKEQRKYLAEGFVELKRMEGELKERMKDLEKRTASIRDQPK